MPEIVTGRAEEMARITASFDDAGTSTARAIVVEGVAGIGKTTLLHASIAEAERRKFAVMGGRAEELEQERAFGTVFQVLRSAGLHQSSEAARELLEATPDDSPFRVLDGVVELVEGLALSDSLLLWVDDLQWADEWSARTLAILRRRLDRLPVTILVGTRPLPRRPETAAALRMLLADGVHIQLAPFDEESVADLIRQRAGAEPSPDLRAVLGRAGGNPFFIRELFDALDRDGMLVQSADAVHVESGATPPGLLVTLLHRMTSFPEVDVELLRLAAVLGGSFTVDHLAIAACQPKEELLQPLRRLREEGVLAEEGDCFRFRHDLLREAVYEDLGGPARTAMHARVGHTFAQAELDVVEVAHHLVRGAPPGDAAAAEEMIKAARSGRIALRESANLLQRALEIFPAHPRSAEMKAWLGSMLQASDRPREAISWLEEALAAQTEPRQRLQILGALAAAALRCGDRAARAKWRTQRAELAAGLEDSGDPSILLAIATTHFDRGDLADAYGVAARAIATARHTEDIDAEADAESMCGWLSTQLGVPGRGASHQRRALDLWRGKPESAWPRFHLGNALAALWEPDAAASELQEAQRLAEKRGGVALQLKTIVETCWLEYQAGRWEEGELQADVAREMMQDLRIRSDGTHPALMKAWVALRTGRPEAVQPLIEEAEGATGVVLHGAWLPQSAALAAEDRQRTDELTKEVFLYFSHRPGGSYSEGLLPAVVRGALACGDDGTAKAAVSLASERAIATDSPSVALDLHRCKALVERDVDAAESAVTVGESCPWPLERAGALEDAAAVLTSRRTELLTRALGIYESVGSVLDQNRVARMAGISPTKRSRSARPVTGWEALTDAERKVVDLAAEGLTNREIGERLFISHRTASTHLAHAFDKLQVRSRVELAREAAARKAATPQHG